jgi:hypothetical protein
MKQFKVLLGCNLPETICPRPLFSYWDDLGNRQGDFQLNKYLKDLAASFSQL